MCVGLPMQVLAVQPGRADVAGRGERRWVDTRLLGEVAVGQWVLVFLDAARESISAERAAEVDGTLDLVASAMAGAFAAATGSAAFALPSEWSAQALAELTGQAPGPSGGPSHTQGGTPNAPSARVPPGAAPLNPPLS